MKRITVVLLCAALLGLCLTSSITQSESKSRSLLQTPIAVIAFVNVNVVPMDKERVLLDQTVIVKDGKVIAISPAAKIKIPKGAQRIDGRGKYLMPGLADMHVHYCIPGLCPNEIEDNNAFSIMFLANGVTTVRNMFGTPAVLTLRQKIDAGQVLGPHIFTVGPIIGRHPATAGRADARNADTVEEAVRYVIEDKRAGYDAIKVVRVTRTVYDSVLAEARKVGLPVYGHVADSPQNKEPVLLEHALESGQKSIEHLDGYPRAMQRDPKQPMSASNTDWSLLPPLIAATKAAGTWVCPTLVDHSKFVTSEEAARLLADPSMKYIPGWLMDRWKQSPSIKQNEQQGAGRKRFFDFLLRLTKALNDGGVGLLAGSDCPNPLDVPGFSLHEDLAFFVKAGLTPYQALRAATNGPAEFLGKQGEFGTVVVGGRADLLLLDANPLDDVRNASRRVGVMVRGRWLTEAELRELLEEQAKSYGKRE